MSYWSFRAERAPDPSQPYTVWPDGCLSLALPIAAGAVRGPLLCTGPRIVAFQPPITPGVTLLGLRFWPDATGRLFGVPARELRDKLGPAPIALARWADGLRESLRVPQDALSESAMRGCVASLDAWASTRLADADEPDAIVRAAIQRIAAEGGELRMGRLAEDLGVGLRQLQRRFPTATGLTLREWARVRRLRSALAQRLERQDGTWSRIAAETGFVDHAHLTREFVQLTGLPPSHVAHSLGRTDHRGVRP